MSKYSRLWEYIQKNGSQNFKLTFEEIQNIAGIPIDHSFLKYKKIACIRLFCGKDFNEKTDGYFLSGTGAKERGYSPRIVCVR